MLFNLSIIIAFKVLLNADLPMFADIPSFACDFILSSKNFLNFSSLIIMYDDVICLSSITKFNIYFNFTLSGIVKFLYTNSLSSTGTN